MNKKFYPIFLVVVLAALAAGFMYWRGQSQSTPLSEQTVADTQSVSTVDWKTYENKKYGYKIELPSSWGTISEYDGTYFPEISQDSDYLFLGTNNGAKVQITVRDDTNSVEHTIDWYVYSYLSESYTRQVIGTRQVAKISGLDGVSVCMPANKEIARCVYLVESNDKLFVIDFSEKNEVTDRVISTFKFLE